MDTGSVELMARPKGRPKAAKTEVVPTPTPRITIINLKGTQGQADWLDAVHRKTHLSKSVIFRLAVAQWAASNGHPAFPFGEDDE